ncbi:TRZ/ATZ family hydrolase [Endothiovibrio diazotrophicus]
MKNVETLIDARWIVPVAPDDRVLEDHSLAIHEGRIIDLLPREEAAAQYHPANRADLGEHVVIPGLINAHAHAAMSLMRGLADDLPLMTWLEEHIWPAEAKWVSPDFVHDGVQLAIAEMIRGGTTCFNDMYFFPDVAARVARAAGIRACMGLIVIDFPTAWASGPDEYFAKGIELHDAYHNEPLIHTAFAPHAPYTVSDGPLERIRTVADELEIPIHMHVHETLFEVEEAARKQGCRPLERLDRLGLLSPSLMAVHMTQLTDGEIARLAESGSHVVHCPESNLKLASGFAPVAKLSAAGVNVALGTDGAASNNDLDMFGEMRTAALLAKAVANDAAAIPAMEALRMATINGARALGIDETTGSLEPGKAADITAVRLDRLETQPLFDPVSQLVYAASRHQVTDVWVAGRQLLHDRRLTTLDEAELTARARAWGAKLAGG